MFAPPVVGHRGAAALAPENTLAGLAAARAAGCRWVEFDVKLSADDVAVLMHDEGLERTTDGRGRVREHRAAALARLDAGGRFAPRFAGEPLPTLAQAIRRLGELDLEANIEIKPCPGRERETGELVAREVLRLWPSDRPAPLFSSFSEAALEAARAVAPEIPRGLLRRRLGSDWAERMQALGCVTLHLHRDGVTLADLARLRELGVPVLIYTVNDPVRARELLTAGAAAVFTDVPDLVLAALAQ